jgi:hypothetical protein
LKSDKEQIKVLYKEGATINGLAREYKVSKRLIQFVLFPERKAKNLEDRKARGGSKQYYNKDKHNEAMKIHRRYKYQLLKNTI